MLFKCICNRLATDLWWISWLCVKYTTPSSADRFIITFKRSKSVPALSRVHSLAQIDQKPTFGVAMSVAPSEASRPKNASRIPQWGGESLCHRGQCVRLSWGVLPSHVMDCGGFLGMSRGKKRQGRTLHCQQLASVIDCLAYSAPPHPRPRWI